MKSLISVENLCWTVKNTLILNQLSFSVSAGHFVGILGPNGSGKSSLLRCLYAKNKVTSGQLLFKQMPLAHFSARQLAQKIAVVLQEPVTQFELRLIDVIGMGLTPNKPLLSFDTDLDRQKIKQVATQVDLDKKLEHEFNSLSGGEKQRAMIARAMLQAPELLLMDEPTNHLDIRHQIEVLSLAQKMNITVMVCMHDLNLAAAYCDYLILLDKGQIIAQGSVDDVLTEENLQQVYAVNTLVDTHPFSKKRRVTFEMD
jgi:iron complex transport system ATP-binding protein